MVSPPRRPGVEPIWFPSQTLRKWGRTVGSLQTVKINRTTIGKLQPKCGHEMGQNICVCYGTVFTISPSLMVIKGVRSHDHYVHNLLFQILFSWKSSTELHVHHEVVFTIFPNLVATEGVWLPDQNWLYYAHIVSNFLSQITCSWQLREHNKLKFSPIPRFVELYVTLMIVLFQSFSQRILLDNLARTFNFLMDFLSWHTFSWYKLRLCEQAPNCCFMIASLLVDSFYIRLPLPKLRTLSLLVFYNVVTTYIFYSFLIFFSLPLRVENSLLNGRPECYGHLPYFLT